MTIVAKSIEAGDKKLKAYVSAKPYIIDTRKWRIKLKHGSMIEAGFINLSILTD